MELKKEYDSFLCHQDVHKDIVNISYNRGKKEVIEDITTWAKKNSGAYDTAGSGMAEAVDLEDLINYLNKL